VERDDALYEEYSSFSFRRSDIAKIAKLAAGFGATVVGLDFVMDFNSS
tara:strand:+ start:407 stop:550 length:144 start_codon:yes stop_codon:yes gene_type:complete